MSDVRAGGIREGDVRVGDVQVVAHRGATLHAPEHTLAAYRNAVRIGADAVECDVRLTRDGTLVCVHDRRVSTTSNGHGVVSALELAELERFRFGARRPSRWTLRYAQDELPTVIDEPDQLGEDDGRVLTLDRLLEYVTATPGTVRLAIETKHPTRHARKVEETLVGCLRHFGLLRDDGAVAYWAGRPAVRVMSFSPVALHRVHEMAPGLPTVQLVRRQLRPLRDDLLLGPAGAVGPGIVLLRADPDYVRRAHAAGKQVLTWTANSTGDMDYVVGLGVDAVVTDRPAKLLRRLGRGVPTDP